mmetsp:Transcript_31079/g.41093  ORF Transcript_31079/g.41093 Transcript_31079/m.41093 type:complete len:861 (+) Transcript_31079:122-2704(+)
MHRKSNDEILVLSKFFILEAIRSEDFLTPESSNLLEAWLKSLSSWLAIVLEISPEKWKQLIEALIEDEGFPNGLCPSDGLWKEESLLSSQNLTDTLGFSVYETVGKVEDLKDELARRLLSTTREVFLSQVLEQIIQKQGESGSYDARIRTTLKRICSRLQKNGASSKLGWSQVRLAELQSGWFEACISLVDSTALERAYLNQLQRPSREPAWQRGGKIVLASAAGGCALYAGAAVTAMGPMQALMALGAGGLAEFAEFLTGLRLFSSMWGVAGATASGIRASRRTAGVRDFGFVPLFSQSPSNNTSEKHQKSKGLPIFILVPGWFSKHEDPHQVWGGHWDCPPDYESKDSLEESNAHPINVSIPTTSVKEEANKKNTVYHLDVRWQRSHWQTTHRHREFKSLDTALQKVKHIKHLPSFPSSRSWTGSNAAKGFVEERRRKLEVYMQRLCQINAVCQSNCFKDFLKNESKKPWIDQTEMETGSVSQCSSPMEIKACNKGNMDLEPEYPSICFSLSKASKLDDSDDESIEYDDGCIVDEHYFDHSERKLKAGADLSESLENSDERYFDHGERKIKAVSEQISAEDCAVNKKGGSKNEERMTWSQMLDSSCQVMNTVTESLHSSHSSGWWRATVPAGEEHVLVWEKSLLTQLKKQIQNIINEKVKEMVKDEIFNQIIFMLAIPEAHIPMKLLTAFKGVDDPWTLCMKRSKITGIMLAEMMIIKSQEGLHKRPVTLIGFSFGARVVFHCLRHLAKKGTEGQGLIENAVLLGTPVSAKVLNWKEASSVVSGRIINGYSKKDWLLATVFRMKNFSLKIAGFSRVKLQRVENIDLSNIVGSSHFSYEHLLQNIIQSFNLECSYSKDA